MHSPGKASRFGGMSLEFPENRKSLMAEQGQVPRKLHGAFPDFDEF
jgi:hypothetical protein